MGINCKLYYWYVSAFAELVCADSKKRRRAKNKSEKTDYTLFYRFITLRGLTVEVLIIIIIEPIVDVCTRIKYNHARVCVYFFPVIIVIFKTNIVVWHTGDMM